MTSNSNKSSYHIVVLGANGGIGKHTVLKALAEGYHVTAILRTPSKLDISHPNLTIVQGDVMQSGSLAQHLENKDAVISAIGKNSLKTTTLYSQGNKNLLQAMHETGINRAFFISAAGLEVNPTHSLLVKFATRFILQPLLRNMYADLRVMEKIVRESGIDWTIIRPPQLTDSPETGKYRTAIDGPLRKGLKISRADVAHFMVNNLMNKSIFRATVEVGY
ncbi:Putative NADH-flavin reductase [Mucilaginibacter mallensis]|uniref:Putative NADH-flavin reductase n=1 Tax=Mucilaginibacter mallensis TaxID=652787 RepID=A0A1H1SNR4_MUCMA|nr:SDR family oxidoreductase [Mucilaginibacter mallensis]SDS49478.1 Putative NADH-flavin reductase [Mucilaginibacter mallensis]